MENKRLKKRIMLDGNGKCETKKYTQKSVSGGNQNAEAKKQCFIW